MNTEEGRVGMEEGILQERERERVLQPPAHLPCRHVVCLGCRIDHLVNGLHGEVEGHKFAHRTKTSLPRKTQQYIPHK